MKLHFPMNSIKLLSVLALTTLLQVAAPAAPGTAVNDNLYNYLQLMRSDVNSAKVDIINSIMKLDAEDAKKFWPIYRAYENELGNLAINRAELIEEFVQAHKEGTLDNPKAKEMAKSWFKSQRARLNLLEKYHKKIQKVLSPVQAGQFLQIENQMGLFIDVAIASEMPVVGRTGK
jgi:hypothetical protein